MCGPMEVIGLGFQGASMLMGNKAAGKQAQTELDAAYYNAEMDKYEAELIRETARRDSDDIIANAERLRGSQATQQAASGVVIGEGSAQIATDDTTHLAHRDALITMYNGINGALRKENSAEMKVRAGEARADSIKDQQTANLISGIGSIVGTYNTYKSLSTKRTG